MSSRLVDVSTLGCDSTLSFSFLFFFSFTLPLLLSTINPTKQEYMGGGLASPLLPLPRCQC